MDNYAGLFIIHSLLLHVVADFLDGVSDDFFHGDLGLGGDLSQDHDGAALGGGLAGDLGFGVFCEAGIQNGIRHIITEFVWVS